MQIVLCINSSSFNKWLNNDFALNAVTYMYSRILVYIVHVYAYQLFIYTMWIISLTIFLLPHLDKFPSTFWWCKSALYVFAVAGLSHISSHCSLLSPARIAVKSTEPSKSSLKFKRLWTIMTHAVGPLLSSNRTAYCNAILWNVCVSSSLHPFLAWREGSRFFPCSYNCFLWRVFCLSRGFFCCAS